MYLSPFDVLIANSAGTEQDLKYNGTLDEVLTEIIAFSSSQTLPIVDADNWALHPPRIIRAVVDYKIQHPDSPEIETLLREAIDVALGLYSNPTNSGNGVDRLREKIKTMELETLLTSPLHQPSDIVTWTAMHPSKSHRTAQRLASQTLSNDVLFIALAHGGVAAGMDVYLRYLSNSESQDSAFYVARLSVQKLGDKQPRLSARETEYLKTLANGRQVVIFDEDKATGTTLNFAHAYFSTQVFPNQSVMAFSNLDLKRELAALGFGKILKQIVTQTPLKNVHSLIEGLYQKKVIELNNWPYFELEDKYGTSNYFLKKH